MWQDNHCKWLKIISVNSSFPLYLFHLMVSSNNADNSSTLSRLAIAFAFLHFVVHEYSHRYATKQCQCFTEFKYSRAPSSCSFIVSFGELINVEQCSVQCLAREKPVCHQRYWWTFWAFVDINALEMHFYITSCSRMYLNTEYVRCGGGNIANDLSSRSRAVSFKSIDGRGRRFAEYFAHVSFCCEPDLHYHNGIFCFADHFC